ncbi:MAG: hypothetical protein OXC46_01180 [Thaumarchaeota archaeon]|nr:hypothetical protein [Nitrososphaerota archaeon]
MADSSEQLKIILKLVTSYNNLADAIKEGDRTAAIEAVKECAMAGYNAILSKKPPDAMNPLPTLNKDDFKKLVELIK